MKAELNRLMRLLNQAAELLERYLCSALLPSFLQVLDELRSARLLHFRLILQELLRDLFRGQI